MGVVITNLTFLNWADSGTLKIFIYQKIVSAVGNLVKRLS